MRYYLGDVESVMGQIDRSSQKAKSTKHGEYNEDVGSAYIRFKSGLRGLFETESEQHKLCFFGEDGEIEATVGGGLRVKTKGSSEWIQPPLQHTDHFTSEMYELVAAIEEDREHLSSGREGRAALEVLMAIFESSRRRKAIVLPLEEKEHPLELMIESGEME